MNSFYLFLRSDFKYTKNPKMNVIQTIIGITNKVANKIHSFMFWLLESIKGFENTAVPHKLVVYLFLVQT